MKTCPNCHTQYTDDSLRFCLQDGSPLDSLDEAETVVRQSSVPSHSRENVRNLPYAGQIDQESEVRRVSNPPPPGQKKSSTALVVIITALLTVVVVAVGLGAWFFSRRSDSKITKETGTSANNSLTANPRNSTIPISPTRSSDSNAANSSDEVMPVNPAINKVDRERISREVSGIIDEWESASESGDVDSLMGNYAGTLDYYNTPGARSDAVRRDKQRSFAQYDSIDFDISNVSITTNSSGDTATAVFDKEWNFEGAKNSAGKVRSQLQLRKEKGKWVITGERDLKVYYID